MAIQFPCPSCGQPIEVDDEWASKPVACPYCRKTVNAPETTTFVPDAAVTTASPVSPTWGAPPAPEAGRNTISLAGLILACLSLALCLVAKIVARMHYSELLAMGERTNAANSFSEMQRSMLEYLEAQGGYPGWMLALSGLVLASLMLWLAGLVCSVVGLRRPAGRAQRIAAFTTLGILPVVMCCLG